MMRKVFFLLLVCLSSSNLHAWNALGHRVIAQIAYQNMTAAAKERFNAYNQALDNRSFVDAAPWLDELRSQDYLWLKPYHYIDTPYITNKIQVHPSHKTNAILAIEEALQALQDKNCSNYKKGFYFRMLIHVLGDLHQPMHAVSRYSRTFPKGDKGGNLWRFKKNPVANNLHAYWDKGGGLLNFPRKEYLEKDVYFQALVQTILQHKPCHLNSMTVDAKMIAKESYQIAVKQAYSAQRNRKPTRQYQKMVNQISEERLALAGCRLAFLLNSLSAI